MIIFNKTTFKSDSMSSFVEDAKKDFNNIKTHWLSLDPLVRFLDKITLVQILLFGITFIIASGSSFSPIVTNSAMMIFPVIMAGFTFVFRSKINSNIENIEIARKEFIRFLAVILFLIVLTIFYAFTFL